MQESAQSELIYSLSVANDRIIDILDGRGKKRLARQIEISLRWWLKNSEFIIFPISIKSKNETCSNQKLSFLEWKKIVWVTIFNKKVVRAEDRSTWILNAIHLLKINS